MSAVAVDLLCGEESESYDTIEEAIAAAIQMLDPDGRISIHSEDCAHDGEDDASCTCTPIELHLGAQS